MKNTNNNAKTVFIIITIIALSLLALYVIIEISLSLLFGQRSRTIRLPDGVYRCEEYGITIVVNWKVEDPLMNDPEKISIDGFEGAGLKLSFLYDDFNVRSEKYDAGFWGSVKINDDESFDFIVTGNNKSEIYDINNGTILHFVKISNTSQ